MNGNAARIADGIESTRAQGDATKGYHLYGNQADGVFVAAPAWHKYMEAALKGVPDHWYDMPSDVMKQGNSYFARREGEPSVYALDTKPVEELQKAAVPEQVSPFELTCARASVLGRRCPHHASMAFVVDGNPRAIRG